MGRTRRGTRLEVRTMHAALKRPSPRRDTCSVLQIVRGRDEGSGRHVFRGFTGTPLELAVELADDDGGGAPARIFRSYVARSPLLPLFNRVRGSPACVGARVLARARAEARARARARDMRSCRNSPGDVNSLRRALSHPTLLPATLSLLVHPSSFVATLRVDFRAHRLPLAPLIAGHPISLAIQLPPPPATTFCRRG